MYLYNPDCMYYTDVLYFFFQPSLFFHAFLCGVAPILCTLTQSISTDTLWAMTVRNIIDNNAHSLLSYYYFRFLCFSFTCFFTITRKDRPCQKYFLPKIIFIFINESFQVLQCHLIECCSICCCMFGIYDEYIIGRVCCCIYGSSSVWICSAIQQSKQ